jgi:hypothetical protein
MEKFTTDAFGEWENEGGAPIQSDIGTRLMQPRIGPATHAKTVLTGTVNQIEWAEQIMERVDEEFDRVANALKSVAAKQAGQDRTETQALVTILEEKRLAVMAQDRAGYFIHDWQELGDRVRQMVVKDPRYAKIRADQAVRKRTTRINPQHQETHWPEGAEL